MKSRAWLVLIPALAVLTLGCADEPAKPQASPGAGSKAGQQAPKAAAQSQAPATPRSEPLAAPKAAAVAAEPPKAEPKDQPTAEPKPEPKPPAKADPKESKTAVVATVDGEKITREDLDSFTSRVTRGQPIPPARKAEADRQILDMLISQKLLRKFLEGQTIEIDPDLLLEAKVGSYIQQLAKKREAEALALAQTIRKDLDGGAKFEDLAKKHSACPSKDKGGELAAFRSEQMTPAFSDAVKGLKVNELSDPVKTEYGYHVIQRLALAEGSDPGLLHARHILVKAKDPGEEIQKLLGDLRAKAKVENQLPPAPPPMLKGKVPAPSLLDDE